MRAAILLGLVTSSVAISAPGVKDAPPPKPSPLVGDWLLLTQTANGRESPWRIQETVFAFMADGKYSETRDGRKGKPVEYRTDDKADPPTLDIIHVGGITVRWLYRVDGDTLEICSFDDRTVRPTKFEAGIGSKNTIFKLSRVKPKK